MTTKLYVRNKPLWDRHEHNTWYMNKWWLRNVFHITFHLFVHKRKYHWSSFDYDSKAVHSVDFQHSRAQMRHQCFQQVLKPLSSDKWTRDWTSREEEAADFSFSRWWHVELHSLFCLQVCWEAIQEKTSEICYFLPGKEKKLLCKSASDSRLFGVES